MIKTLGLAMLVGVGGWLALTAVTSGAEPTTQQPAKQSISGEVYSIWPFDAKEAAKRQNDTAKALGMKKLLSLDLGNRVPLKLVLIPAGSFMMGSPTLEQENRPSFKGEAQHEVTISKPFYIGVTHVTVAQYAQFVSDTRQKHAEPKFKQAGDHPAVQVSWEDAEAFCQWLSKKSGKAVALPTEAQWEYACRAGTQTRFCFGDKATALGDYSWYSVNSGGMTHPVAKKKPNAWGLYDMHGNAWHWCADYYGPYVVADQTDPTGPKDGTLRVRRGCSWMGDGPANCRSACRNGITPITLGDWIGFRVAVAVDKD